MITRNHPIKYRCRFILIVVLLASFANAELRTKAALSSPTRPLSSPEQISRDSRYPPHWWTPVSMEGKPDWEILPQEAKAGEVILSKRNELGILSNFAATPN